MPISAIGFQQLRTKSLKNVIPPNIVAYTQVIFNYYDTASSFAAETTELMLSALPGAWKIDDIAVVFPMNTTSMTHVVFNRQELYIYGFDSADSETFLEQMLLIESMLKDFDFSSDQDFSKRRLRLAFRKDGIPMFVEEKFRLLPVPFVPNVPMIHESRLVHNKWEITLSTKWGKLDGNQDVEILHAHDYPTSQQLWAAVKAVIELQPMDLVTPVIGNLVDDEGRMIGIIFEVEPEARMLNSTDASLIYSTFERLEQRNLYLGANVEETYHLVWHVGGVIVVQNRLRFINFMLWSWPEVYRHDPEKEEPDWVLLDAKDQHWDLADRLVQSGIDNDKPDAWPLFYFDYHFYESFTIIFPPQRPLTDMFTSMTFSFMRSSMQSAEKKRQRRLKDAKSLRIKGTEGWVRDEGHLATDDEQRAIIGSGEPIAFRGQSAANLIVLHEKPWSDSSRVSSIGPSTSEGLLGRRKAFSIEKQRRRIPYDFYYKATREPTFWIVRSSCPGCPLYEPGHGVELSGFTEPKLHEFIRNGFRMHSTHFAESAYVEEVNEFSP